MIYRVISKYRQKPNTFTKVKGERIKVDDYYSKVNIEITKQDVMISLAKMSVVRWDTICYLNGGAMKGVNHGTLSNPCYEEVKQAQSLIISVIGVDPGILDPGYYSKVCA